MQSAISFIFRYASVIAFVTVFSAAVAGQNSTEIKTVSLYPGGVKSGVPITVSFQVRYSTPPLDVLAAVKSKKGSAARAIPNRSTPEGAYVAMAEANHLGDADAILASMTPGERAKKMTLIMNDQIRAKNSTLLEENARETIYETVLYGDYALVRVETVKKAGPRRVLAYTMQKVGEEWLFTNEFSDDPFVSFLMTKLPIANPAAPRRPGEQ